MLTSRLHTVCGARSHIPRFSYIKTEDSITLHSPAAKGPTYNKGNVIDLFKLIISYPEIMSVFCLVTS